MILSFSLYFVFLMQSTLDISKTKIHPKLLIFQSKFSVPRKLTLRYLQCEIKGVDIGIEHVSEVYFRMHAGALKYRRYRELILYLKY